LRMPARTLTNIGLLLGILGRQDKRQWMSPNPPSIYRFDQF
jgi:hypothetical protein